MTDPPLKVPTSLAGGPPLQMPDAGETPRDEEDAGQNSPGRRVEGRASSFRENEAKRRSARREILGQALVILIIVLGVVAILSARPYIPGSSSLFPNPGPPIVVSLGSPTTHSVTCGDGGTAYVEQVIWTGASQQVTTGDVSLRVYEIWDGDFIPSGTVVPNVTSSSLCAGTPPAASPSTIQWYVVMVAPNGTTMLSYTFNIGWTSVTGGPWNLPVENGSSLFLITGVSIANTGRGLAVGGFAGGSSIHGSIPL